MGCFPFIARRAAAVSFGAPMMLRWRTGIEASSRGYRLKLASNSAGLAVAVPDGHAGLVLPRSGLARQHGVTVANAPGLIDQGYRGELMVLLVNLGARPHRIEAGDRVAQLVVAPVSAAAPVEVSELPASAAAAARGAGGFGSTGR